jgi:hypothetical protein
VSPPTLRTILRAALGPADVLRSAALVALVVSALVGAGVATALLIVSLTSQQAVQSSIDGRLENQLDTLRLNPIRLTEQLRQPQPPVPPSGRPAAGRPGWGSAGGRRGVARRGDGE